MNFAERRKQAEDAGLLGAGDYLKLKEGANRFRLMSECLPHQSVYQNRKTFKWLCYVIDRTDGKVKPFFMAHTIYKQIEALQLNPDYEFFDVPMPYDLTLNAKGAGTIDVEYSLIPARKETPITDEELKQLGAAKPLADLQKALKEKKDKQASTPQPSDQDHGEMVDGDAIPF